MSSSELRFTKDFYAALHVNARAGTAMPLLQNYRLTFNNFHRSLGDDVEGVPPSDVSGGGLEEESVVG